MVQVTVSTEYLCAVQCMLSATAEIFVGSPCIVKLGLTFFENKVLIKKLLALFVYLAYSLHS
jgi:hypothetical protein